jgi:hypothetical protein
MSLPLHQFSTRGDDGNETFYPGRETKIRRERGPEHLNEQNKQVAYGAV